MTETAKISFGRNRNFGQVDRNFGRNFGRNFPLKWLKITWKWGLSIWACLDIKISMYWYYNDFFLFHFWLIRNRIQYFLLDLVKKNCKKSPKWRFFPFRCFGRLTERFGRNVSAVFHRNFGRTFGFGRTLVIFLVIRFYVKSILTNVGSKKLHI